MTRLEFSDRFAQDLADVTSRIIESRAYETLDSIEVFGGLGSKLLPDSIREEFDGDVRKVVIDPFDLIYTYYPGENLARIEALVHQRAAK